MLTSNDVKVSRIKDYLDKIVNLGWKDQSIKNKIHVLKKEEQFEDYLALKCAYEIHKLNCAD